MCKERAKTRCVQCELVQWADHAHCRRCGQALPAPITNVIERVVERVVIQQDSQCLENLEAAAKLISATAAKLQESRGIQELPVRSLPISGIEPFPTLDAMERDVLGRQVKCFLDTYTGVVQQSEKSVIPLSFHCAAIGLRQYGFYFFRVQRA
jgi:hypothetical protein